MKKRQARLILFAITSMIVASNYTLLVSTRGVRVAEITTRTIHADRDVQVSSGNPEYNGGGKTDLQIGQIFSSMEEVYVHFNLSLNWTHFRSGKLILISSSPSARMNLSFWRVMDAWNEYNVTWLHKPAPISHVRTLGLTNQTTNIEFDITALINRSTEISLCINASTEMAYDVIFMLAREASINSPGARIVLTFDDGITPIDLTTVIVTVIMVILAGMLVTILAFYLRAVKRDKKKPVQVSSQPNPFTAQLQPQQQHPPSVVQQEETDRFCGNCGTEFEPGMQYCPNCGHRRNG